MSFLGNIVWLVFGGFLAGMGYIIGGVGMCLTIVGIPFGLQSIKLGVASMTPFGKEVIENEKAEGPLSLLFTIIWIVVFGWEIAIAHLLSAALLAISVVGLPFAKQHVKLIPVALFPFGRELK